MDMHTEGGQDSKPVGRHTNNLPNFSAFLAFSVMAALFSSLWRSSFAPHPSPHLEPKHWGRGVYRVYIEGRAGPVR